MADEPGRSAERRTAQSRPPLEQALRRLAIARRSTPLGLLVDAISDPGSDEATILGPLIKPFVSLDGVSDELRAMAAWGLIIESVRAVDPNERSQRHNVMRAAFRLPPPPEIAEPWQLGIGQRFAQLKNLTDIFGDNANESASPMQKIWNETVRAKLPPRVRQRLRAVVDAETLSGWAELAQTTEHIEVDRRSPNTSTTSTKVRRPSEHAQPVYMELFVTSVFMRNRSVFRRITERVLTARADGVDHYIARALAGQSPERSNTPVRALIGCTARPLLASATGEPLLTRLEFPTALQEGQSHYFSSEIVDENITEERLWINVEIDHYGIAEGERHKGYVPISGLTIRVRFDHDHLPSACWAYAEQTERERRIQPPAGDPRWLALTGDTVEYTFPEPCQPRENYGISILWP